MDSRQIFVLLLSAGVGSRMKSQDKKQFLTINKIPLFIWSIRTFFSLSKEIQLKPILVYSSNDFKRFESILKEYIDESLLNQLILVEGGKERYNSVYNGLKSVSDIAKENDIVLIHDCARPLIQKHDIIKIIDELKTYSATTLGYSVSDTIKEVDQQTLEVTKHLNRSRLKGILTPQGFHFNIIWTAYQKFIENTFPITDDTELVQSFGFPVTVVEGEKTNIKVTTKEDLIIAEVLLKNLM